MQQQQQNEAVSARAVLTSCDATKRDMEVADVEQDDSDKQIVLEEEMDPDYEPTESGTALFEAPCVHSGPGVRC